MFNQIESERFDKRVCVKEVRVSADIFASSLMTESAAEVDILVPDYECQVLLDLYERLCQFSFRHGEDLQQLFQTDKYVYMTCFIHDVATFETEFVNEDFLKPLFSHGKGGNAMYLISFPEVSIQP
ncbi:MULTISPECIES: hypothetical protein [unclassified Enterobacter cloacae complex]|uniref:hypothetical protein n=1 Tax=unclassified Enterobacter cloacae complex TaxID=2757714 RepID=UPI001876C850|nr:MULTISPECIES: hypothetical protein [unclassified Enterobacter cloacae complex]MBE4946841.1 hypothetical protein [Enterobacter cloacae complex sp. P1B]MBE4971665.1 hypothetical protein [Enterobacter cloacae complex sp. P11RS]